MPIQNASRVLPFKETVIAGRAAATMTESIATTTETKHNMKMVILKLTDFFCSLSPSCWGSDSGNSSSGFGTSFGLTAGAERSFSMAISSDEDEGFESTVLIIGAERSFCHSQCKLDTFVFNLEDKGLGS